MLKFNKNLTYKVVGAEAAHTTFVTYLIKAVAEAQGLPKDRVDDIDDMMFCKRDGHIGPSYASIADVIFYCRVEDDAIVNILHEFPDAFIGHDILKNQTVAAFVENQDLHKATVINLDTGVTVKDIIRLVDCQKHAFNAVSKLFPSYSKVLLDAFVNYEPPSDSCSGVWGVKAISDSKALRDTNTSHIANQLVSQVTELHNHIKDS